MKITELTLDLYRQNRMITYLLIAGALLMSADLISSVIALQNGHIEANPVMRWLITAGGIELFILGNVLLSAVIAGGVAYGSIRYIENHRYLPLLVMVLGRGITVGNNIVILFQ